MPSRPSARVNAIRIFGRFPCHPDQLPEVAAIMLVELIKHALAGVEFDVLTPAEQQ